MQEFYMLEAIEEAKKAYMLDEVPVGAVIVRNGEIIARAHNLRETLKDATAHAEILAIKEACRRLNGWRLIGCEMYVTLEPCPMCAGALVNSRIEKIVFGAYDLRAGSCGSIYNIPGDERLNHRPVIVEGFMEEECKGLMQSFFKGKRNKNTQVRPYLRRVNLWDIFFITVGSYCYHKIKFNHMLLVKSYSLNFITLTCIIVYAIKNKYI